jgi:hypothetical protein
MRVFLQASRHAASLPACATEDEDFRKIPQVDGPGRQARAHEVSNIRAGSPVGNCADDGSKRVASCLRFDLGDERLRAVFELVTNAVDLGPPVDPRR